jgi:hypothetical protein
MGLTGLEPVTLRLSSACSNQLSYRPEGKNCLTPVLSVIADHCYPFAALSALTVFLAI